MHADNLHHFINQQHPHIKYEIEKPILYIPTDNSSIKTEIITTDKGPINLRLKEVYCICNEQPSINFCFILFYHS